jgi:membrane fusion protein (multidrug efflux system)
MTLTKKIIIPAVVVLLVALVAWKIIGASSSGDPRKVPTPIVQVEQPRRESVLYQLKFTGDVVPIQQASIYSKVSGNLERIYSDMGQFVRANQMLALIDTTELYQQYQQDAATYQNARLNYERTKELSEQNLVAKQDLDNAESTMKVERAKAEASKTHLDYAHITAPFSGYITKRFLDPGANVTPNNATLFTLMDIDRMKIVVNAQEKDIPFVTIGKKAIVTVDAFPDRQFSGQITRLSQAVDLSTRTMAVEIDVPNNDHQLKPGMFASVTVIVNEHKDAITVPTQALLKDDRGNFVYVLGADNTAQRKDIKQGIEQNSRTEILSGLGGSERIITTGQQFVKAGGQVTVQ